MSAHPIAKQGLVLRTRGMDEVVVQRDVPLGGGVADLRMDVYRPPEDASAALPVVVLVTGYSDARGRQVLGCNLKDIAAYIDWARLIASSSMVAITYQNEEPVRDIDLLLRHIDENAGPLRLDAARIGLWACSGNVPNALALLGQERPIRCAALCYGYMVDLDGADDVACGARQWGFATPPVEMRSGSFARTPTLIVRAGRDEMPGLNRSIDRFVACALRENLHVTVVNQPTGPHAFDILDPSRDSRQAIRQVVEFLRRYLLEQGPSTGHEVAD